jgi:hypothetical protein
VDVVADLLNKAPSSGNISELRPCDINEAIGLAISTAEEEDERVDREVLQCMLLRSQIHRVWLSLILHEKVCGHCELASGSTDYMAEIAENVVIGIGGNDRIELQAIPGQQIRDPGRMNTQLHDHWCRLRAIVGNPVTRVNPHRCSCRSIAGQTQSFNKNEAAKKFRCGSLSRGNTMHFSRHD